MYTISPEVVIANYFAEVYGSTELRLSTLAKIKVEIERIFSEKRIFLSVDTTWESISDAVYSNRKYFYFDENNSVICFRLPKTNEFYEDVYAIFNSKFEENRIKFLFLTTLEDLLAKIKVE